MAVKTIGPATVWECTKCGDRYVGVLGDKRTGEWQEAHRSGHVEFNQDPWSVPEMGQ